MTAVAMTFATKRETPFHKYSSLAQGCIVSIASGSSQLRAKSSTSDYGSPIYCKLLSNCVIVWLILPWANESLLRPVTTQEAVPVLRPQPEKGFVSPRCLGTQRQSGDLRLWTPPPPQPPCCQMLLSSFLYAMGFTNFEFLCTSTPLPILFCKQHNV